MHSGHKTFIVKFTGAEKCELYHVKTTLNIFDNIIPKEAFFSCDIDIKLYYVVWTYFQMWACKGSPGWSLAILQSYLHTLQTLTDYLCNLHTSLVKHQFWLDYLDQCLHMIPIYVSPDIYLLLSANRLQNYTVNILPDTQLLLV